ncbi:MAG: DUF523 domain-containing protein [Lachnospiraceae bacterium]|nr:DUF523 domain-containing protein [Lachnospiraceae bacterium]
MIILISACLVGIGCKYNGEIKDYPNINALLGRHTLIPVCPEQLGGLPTPRNPVEIKDSNVVDSYGNVFTQEFEKGANEVLKIAKMSGAQLVVLKSNSPSCGLGKIYDGTFTSTLIDGNGITANLLKENGFTVKTEKDI